MSQRIEPFKKRLKVLNPFFSMTQRIEPSFWKCFNELNLCLVWLKELNFFLSRNMTQRIEPFFECDSQRIEPFFFSKYMTRWIEPFFSKMIQNFELSLRNMSQIIEYDSKNWFFILKNHSYYRTFFLTQRIEPCLNFDSKNCFFFFQKIDSKNWTFFFQYVSKNSSFFLKFDSKNNWTFFMLKEKTQRIEPLF